MSEPQVPPAAGTEHDEQLAALVQLANAFGIEQEVVLTLSGHVVSGTLTSAKAHFDELATTVQGSDGDETLRGSLAARFRTHGEDLAQWGAGSKLGDLDPDTPEAPELAPMPDPEFVHLRRVTVGGVELPLWRGRLSGVVGWTVLARHEDVRQ